MNQSPFPYRQPLWLLMILLTALGLAPALADAATPDKIDYQADIRPILSDYCFACHGPDKKHRKAKLRLDTKDGLFATRDDITAVKPHDLKN